MAPLRDRRLHFERETTREVLTWQEPQLQKRKPPLPHLSRCRQAEHPCRRMQRNRSVLKRSPNSRTNIGKPGDARTGHRKRIGSERSENSVPRKPGKPSKDDIGCQTIPVLSRS